MEVLTISITVVLLAAIIDTTELKRRPYKKSDMKKLLMTTVTNGWNAKERLSAATRSPQGWSKPTYPNTGETFKEKEKASRDPTIDIYQNMEGKNKDDDDKTKFTKESMHASQPVQSMSVKGTGRVRWS